MSPFGEVRNKRMTLLGNSSQQLKTGATAMVGAIPKTSFHVAGIDLPGAVGFFEPVAVNAVYEMGFDEIPDFAHCGGESGVAGEFIGVGKPDERFRLGPPVFFIDKDLPGDAFVKQTAVCIAPFTVNRFRQP